MENERLLTDEELKTITSGGRQSLFWSRKIATAQDAKTEEIMKRRTWCAYCGKEYPLDTVTADQIGEHIATCEKHPLYEAKQQNAKSYAAGRKAAAEEIVELSTDWDYYVDNMQGFRDKYPDYIPCSGIYQFIRSRFGIEKGK
jgi:hypothetical protein